MGHYISTLKSRIRASDRRTRNLKALQHKPNSLADSPGFDSDSGRPEQDLTAILRPIITSFVSDIGCIDPAPEPSEALWVAMRAYADQLGVNYDKGTHSWNCFQMGITYSAACLPKHSLEVQVYIGTYTWLGILIDDETSKSPEDCSKFIERFAAGEKQPTPLLEGWAELMRLAYKYWDPVVANFIVTASLNFVNANVLENRQEFKKLKPTKGGKKWPWFMRDKDGVSDAYALFTFPKDQYQDMSNYLEMIPDMSCYLALTNDILSFYKEERNGEVDNYVHGRAWYENKEATQVLEDVIGEVKEGVRRIRVVLDGREPYLQATNDYILGYVAFHKLVRRYRLWEVGLGEHRA
ncbi:Alpha-cuprenene synthase COP6 [Colletotrichum fructicola]|nr:Alpha-cuprenene synthase COP6 [Colletotrichum fructicola]KAF4937752.1 Alpha-cuprenene synthase COP6 [Colletotrichum fructicola]KAF5508782.1 Alpha-cuprenene synthase COP6 [Colletotrichum fructicola]